MIKREPSLVNGNEVMNLSDNIDMCECYEPMISPSKEQEKEWKAMREYAEPNPETNSYYGVEPDGTMYFYYGNTRTKVSEIFASDGNTMSGLIEDVIRYSKRNTK